MNTRDDSGAMAVLVAVLTVVLFAMAAVAVEITDMYSRDRAAQTTADLAALAGAQGLPDSCQAFETALDNLNATFAGSPGVRANGIRDADGRQNDELTRTEMSDRDLSNGEIQVLTSFDGITPPPDDTSIWLPTAGCVPSGTGVDTARFVRVITPARTVDFAFALGLQPYAADPIPTSGDVQAVAAAAIRSPRFGDNIPVFLPSTCTFGAQFVVTDSPSAETPSGGSPRYDPSGANGSQQAPVIESVTSSRVSGGRVTDVLVEVSNLAVAPLVTSIGFDFHTGSGGSTVRWPETPPSPDGSTTAPTTLVSATATAPFEAVYEVALNDFIVSRGGEWFVRGVETSGPNVDRFTRAANAVAFTVEATPAAGCGDPSTGNFGYLRADRDDSNNFELDRNFIEGLDFEVTAIPQVPPINTPCSGPGSPATAVPATTNPTTDGANCLEIESGGNRGPVTFGLIEGRGGLNGRLYAASNPTPPGSCSEPGGGSDFTWTTPTNPAVPIWNTVLSCYVTSGSLADLETCDSCLSAEIINDPRYFIVPVLNTDIRPPSSTQWPIREFVGAFITNENYNLSTGADVPATCAATDDCNGLKFNNGTQTIFSVQTFVFPLSALPDEVQQTTGDGGEFTGAGPREFVLVE